MAQLHGQLGNDLSPATGHRVAQRRISGVHISELEDPTPYLEGGELLLTTGIPLSGPSANVAAYVRRLVHREVAALGLGLGAGLDEVPGELLEACRGDGLELLVVPAGTPFMNVSRAYWDLVAREGQADLTASLGTQTALARAATQPDALAQVIKALAQALGGWAAYLPADHAAATFWPESNRAIVGQLRIEAFRLNMAATHSASTFQIHGTDVVEYPVLVGRTTVGVLAIGAGRKLTRADRQVILTVCVLLSLKAAQGQEKDAMAAALGSAVAKLFLSGHVEAGYAQAADLGISVPRGAVRVLVVRGTQDAAADASAIATRLPRETGWAAAGAAMGDCRLRHQAGELSYWLLDADSASGVDRVHGANGSDAANDQVRPVGTAGPVKTHGLGSAGDRGVASGPDGTYGFGAYGADAVAEYPPAGAFRQAVDFPQTGALPQTGPLPPRGAFAPAGALPRETDVDAFPRPAGLLGRRGAGEPDIAAVLSRPMPMERVRDEAGQLAALVRGLEPGQLLAATPGVLDPRVQDWVAALRGYARADLVATVRAYLRHRGQWEGAARELGVHRNSLRHRMAIVSGLLRADPDDPDVAANLWLALRSE
nr:PucR family transcriptional regulator [Arthrobacter sp. SDTb3-6]